MAKTISELKAQSAEVKNASAIGENTATRVGQLFGDIVEHVEQYETNKDGKDASQDAQMQSLVSAEESRAKGEERGLQNQIHAEKIDRQTADTYLSNLIQQESSARETADENIRTALANETARAQAAEQELAAAQIYTAKIKDGAVTTSKIADGAVTYEKTDIIAQELGTNITKVPSQKVVTDAIRKEETERKADVNGLAAALASETIQREQGDENLNAAIEAKINGLTAALASETIQREQGDENLNAAIEAKINGLTAALASETIQREQGDENLNAAIEAEINGLTAALASETIQREQGDENLNAAIEAEKDRAEAREQELTVAIQQETERAEAAEEANATSIINTDRIADGAVTTEKLADSALMNQLKKTATFAGIATPETNPETPTGSVYYLALQKGEYTNFNNTVLDGRKIYVFYNNEKNQWLSESLGEVGSGKLMNPYFPFAETATFFLNKGNNSGMTEEEAESFIFAIYMDKGDRTGSIYLSWLTNLDGNLYGRFSKNGVVIASFSYYIKDNTENDLVFLELIEENNSGYHGWIILNPLKRIHNSLTTGTLEQFALDEKVFNKNALVEAFLNKGKIEKLQSDVTGKDEEYKYIFSHDDKENILNGYFSNESTIKKLNDEGVSFSSYPIFSTETPQTYPTRLLNKRQFFLSKDLGSPDSNIRPLTILLLREINHINFSAWLYFSNNLGYSKTALISFNLGKIYPFGAFYTDAKITISINNKTDYTNAKSEKIKYTITNPDIGDIDYYVDDYIAEPNGKGLFVHISMEKNIPVRYGVLWFVFEVGTIAAGNNNGEDIALIDPIIRTNDEYKYTADKCAYNYGYSMALGDFVVRGKKGRINLESIKKPVNMSVSDAVSLSVIDNGQSVDLKFTGENLAATKNANFFWVNQGYYRTLFDSTKRLYIQFDVSIDEIKKIKRIKNAENGVAFFNVPSLLTQGLKINISNINDYANCKSFVLGINGDIATVRFEIYGSNWGINVEADTPITSLTLYNFCVSEKPIDPKAGIFISKQRMLYPSIAGKTFTIFGDSEFNSGLQYLNVTTRLGMPCFVAAYGGHKMAWANDNTSVDKVTKSWLYTWDIRKDVLNNNTDFYIFCVSTNDSDAGISASENSNGKYEYQSLEDADVQFVLDNYPAFGDNDETVADKISKFGLLDASTKHQKFNMTSVYCAYIEQILSANPNAKIILTNSPITCTGLLTGSADASGKGIWQDGINPKEARKAKKIIFDRLDELMRKIGEKYNLPVIDFYRNVGLTFENFTNYCQDGTHWVDIKDTNVLHNTNPITNREGDMLVKYLTELIH